MNHQPYFLGNYLPKDEDLDYSCLFVAKFNEKMCDSTKNIYYSTKKSPAHDRGLRGKSLEKFYVIFFQ